MCVPLAVKVYGPEAQANLSQLAACLAIRSNFCKSMQATSALYGRLNLVLVKANARAGSVVPFIGNWMLVSQLSIPVYWFLFSNCVA